VSAELRQRFLRNPHDSKKATETCGDVKVRVRVKSENSVSNVTLPIFDLAAKALASKVDGTINKGILLSTILTLDLSIKRRRRSDQPNRS